MPEQYTAEVIRSDGTRSKLYIDGLWRRIEIYGPSGVQSMVISRPDKGVAWSLIPGRTSFYETPLTQQQMQSAFDPTALLDWKQDGTEVIDGHECLRFVGRYTFPAGAAYEVCFVDARTGIHRRTVTYDKTGRQALTVDSPSVVLGPPPASVFEIPEGYSVEKQ